MSITGSLAGIALLSGTAVAANLGKWGPTIQFPLVPVAAAVIPSTAELLVWSAYRNDSFQTGAQNVTQTAVWTPTNNVVKYFEVAYTDHDMFCPGVSFDFNGDLIVTGGDTAPATSILNPNTWQWTKAPNMQLARGYQSSATLSDGRVFTIGGSWSGGLAVKNGEVWDGSKWTLLNGCDGKPMLTADRQGIFRQDNHAWLFGWKSGSVFQAGPSKAMNWYFTSGTGSWSAAGTRNNDGDAMCGPAVMYDATAGKILTAGGSPNYQDSLATNNAYLITIGTPGNKPSVETLRKMRYARIFSTSTVLPDGSVLVLGGQTYGHPFSDANSTQVPELWNPNTKSWKQLVAGPTPRAYHSVSVLMPNGTVFNGGGGLCGNCGSSNHFDGQLFSPPYLFKSDGITPAVRPTISKVSASTVGLGKSLQATISNPSGGSMTFSLIRMGSSTHTVNTDQRRVPVTPSSSSGSVYTLPIPSDVGVVTPGYWYLWAMSSGVPGTAQIIKITP